MKINFLSFLFLKILAEVVYPDTESSCNPEAMLAIVGLLDVSGTLV